MRPELCVATVFWHSPSNAHTYRLLIFKELRWELATSVTDLLSAKTAILTCFSKHCQTLGLSVSSGSVLGCFRIQGLLPKSRAYDYSTAFHRHTMLILNQSMLGPGGQHVAKRGSGIVRCQQLQQSPLKQPCVGAQDAQLFHASCSYRLHQAARLARRHTAA